MRSFHLPSPLYEAAGPNAGGAGFTDEQLAALGTLLDSKLNVAFRKFDAKILKIEQNLDPVKLASSLAEPLHAILNPSPEDLAEYRDDIQRRVDAGEAVEPEELDFLRESVEDDHQPGGRPPARQPDAQTNAQLLELRNANTALTRRLADLEKTGKEDQERAAQAILEKEVGDVLGGYQLAGAEAKEILHDFYVRNAKRAEDGSLVVKTAAGDLPLKDAAEARIRSLPGLLQPRNVAGAGATSLVGGRGDQGPTLESIKPGQSREERAALSAQLGQTLSNAMQGKG